jgi:outer membrane protein
LSKFAWPKPFFAGRVPLFCHFSAMPMPKTSLPNLKLVFSLLITNFFVVGCFAQEPLSLSDAVTKGLAQNFGILIERQNIAANKVNNDWGVAGRYPTITLNLNQNNTFNYLRNSEASVAFQQGRTINNGVIPSMNVNWVIFDGFRINLTKERLAGLQRQSEGNARIVIENTVQAIIMTYYDAVRARERLDLLAKALKLSRERYEYMQFKRDVGSAVVTDVLLEKTNYLSDSSSLLNQEVVYRTATRNLNALIAEKEVQKNYRLTDSLVFDDLPYSFADLKDKMLASNSNLQTQYIVQELLKNDVRLRQSDQYPIVSFNATGTYTRNRQNLEGATFVNGVQRPNNTATVQNYAFVVGASMPLFNGGQIRRAIQNAGIMESMGSLRIDNLKLSLERDLAEAHDLYDLRRQLVKIARENKAAAETNLQLAAEKFRTGSINSFEYRILQTTYLDIAFGEIQAIFNVLDAKTNLMRLTGGILNEND